MGSIDSFYVVHRRGLVTVSLMNILLALTSIGLEIYVLSTNPLFLSPDYTHVQGIWCGVFYLSAGFMGFVVASKTTKYTLVIAVVDTLLSVIFAVVCAVLTAQDGCLQESCNGEVRAIGVSFIACSFFVMMVSLIQLFILSLALCGKTQSNSVSMLSSLTATSLTKIPMTQRTYE